MTTLNDIPAGSTCRITWMVSGIARSIKEFCRMETDDRLRIISNTGSGVIIAAKRYALSKDAASSIRVETESS